MVLVENAGKLMEREALIQAVWADTFVEDANLTVAISHLRRALGQDGETAEYIETIPRVGYRFVAEVRETFEESKPLIIEKHTQSRTVIEEELLPDYRPATTETLVVQPAFSFGNVLGITIGSRQVLSAVGVLIVAVGSFLYLRRGNERVVTAGNLAGNNIRSIAVLPPKSLRDESENESLSLGIADALITRLGGIRKLKVRPTSAIMRYVGTNQDPLGAGRALGVDAVLDGTLQRDGGRTRVTLRLLNVVNGSQLWTGSFEEGEADVFKLQDLISQQLASALYSDLSQNEKVSLSKPQTSNAEAYVLYLKGCYFWNKRDIAKSVDYLRKAIELDPNFAQAYVTLAAVDACTTIPSPEAELLIDRALQLDNNLAEAHATYAFIRMFHHWDWDTAEKELDRAIELNPNSSIAHHWKGVYFSIRGRIDEAKAEMHRALELDPLSFVIMADIGQLHYFAHEYDQAQEYCNRALALDPDFRAAHDYLLEVYSAKGMDQEYLSELIRIYYRDSPAEVKQNFRQAFAHGGIRAVAQLQFKSYVELNAPPLGFGRLYCRIGDKEKALYWLARSLDEPKLFWTAYLGVDPLYDPLRTDPRFKAILNRLGLQT